MASISLKLTTLSAMHYAIITTLLILPIQPNAQAQHNLIGWRNLQIYENAKFHGVTFVDLLVENAQQCLRMCWLYKACTLVTYSPMEGSCSLTAMGEVDVTSHLRHHETAWSTDMRQAEVEKVSRV